MWFHIQVDSTACPCPLHVETCCDGYPAGARHPSQPSSILQTDSCPSSQLSFISSSGNTSPSPAQYHRSSSSRYNTPPLTKALAGAGSVHRHGCSIKCDGRLSVHIDLGRNSAKFSYSVPPVHSTSHPLSGRAEKPESFTSTAQC